MTPSSLEIRWPPTRAEGLRRLEQFVPRSGRTYAETRNEDRGPHDQSNVSTLSPYIRHRLIREDEVVTAVLDRFAYSTAEKFIAEACWRTYWKGWLEHRPAVWATYRAAVANSVRRLDGDTALRDSWESATSGRTGIDCFDAWARELIATGYLHNHARMWFASIWIFTLRLPWELGADFFLRHLLDGDPASNTLSWRWVAGLHTRGKTYLARPDNIAKYTGGRFLTTQGLAPKAEPLHEDALPSPTAPDPFDHSPRGDFGLILTEDDLDPASLGLAPERVVAVCGLLTTAERSPLELGRLPREFATGAVRDALERSRAIFSGDVEVEGWQAGEETVLDWVSRHKLKHVVTPRPTVGPTREWLERFLPSLRSRGVIMSQVGRPWDETFWPYCKSGFFALRTRIPACLASLGMNAGARQSRRADRHSH
jgi:deoxyribodipyrimidine photo-lyase